MGNGLTIITVSGIQPQRSIAEKWHTTLTELPLDEKVTILIQMLDSVINGMLCGLNANLDYIFLRCEEPVATELYTELQSRPELVGLEIKVLNHKSVSYQDAAVRTADAGTTAAVAPISETSACAYDLAVVSNGCASASAHHDPWVSKLEYGIEIRPESISQPSPHEIGFILNV